MPARKFVPVGTRFNRLVVLASFPDPSTSYTACKVRCDCGNERVVTAGHLRSGHVSSCGCLQIERTTKHGMYGTPEYHAWTHMTNRCYCSTNKAFKNYGARGISVCDRWRGSFENFYADMGPRPKGASIERIDNNGNYEPTNCRWATRSEQNRNTRRNRWLTARGRTQCIADWAKEAGIRHGIIRNRLHLGWTAEAAIFTPPSGWGHTRKHQT